MKRLIFIVIATILPALAISQTRVDEIRARLLDPSQGSVLVVSHRADWRSFPENSLPAIESAIAMGVDMIEIDIQRMADGQLILMHDKTLNRTTTGKGEVGQWTLDSIRTLNLKNGCAIRTKHRVPTLEEALLTAKGRVMVNIDKGDAYFGEVYELATRTGTLDHIVMKGSRSPDEVRELFGPWLDEIIYMPIVNLDKDGAKETLMQFLDELSPAAFELVYARPDNTLPIEATTLLGGRALIWYNTLWDTLAGGHDDDLALDDPDAAYGYLVRTLGASLIQTDRPAYLLDYLRAQGLRQ